MERTHGYETHTRTDNKKCCSTSANFDFGQFDFGQLAEVELAEVEHPQGYQLESTSICAHRVKKQIARAEEQVQGSPGPEEKLAR